jgi:hypothetical protein
LASEGEIIVENENLPSEGEIIKNKSLSSEGEIISNKSLPSEGEIIRNDRNRNYLNNDNIT